MSPPDNITKTLGGVYDSEENINKEFIFEKAGYYIIYVEAD